MVKKLRIVSHGGRILALFVSAKPGTAGNSRLDCGSFRIGDQPHAQAGRLRDGATEHEEKAPGSWIEPD